MPSTGSKLARILTLHIDSVLDGIDDGALREFLKGPEATAIRESFFDKNGLSYVAVLVTHTPEP